MIDLCQHQMPSGKTCQSPALVGQPLCFHHDREATQTRFILTLPALTNRSSLLLALSQVVVAMGLGQIDTQRANLLLRSLSLATRLISAIEKEAKTASRSKPQIEAVSAVEEPVHIQASPKHRSLKPQNHHHLNNRLPRSMREKVEAIRRANTRG